jgi:hypothetical protein
MASSRGQLPNAVMEHNWFDLLAIAPRDSDMFKQAMKFYLAEVDVRAVRPRKKAGRHQAAVGVRIPVPRRATVQSTD